MAIRLKQVEATPNPHAMKFVLDGPITEQRLSFATPAAAAGHRLAERLFAIPGVASLLLLGDFVTVSKSPAAKWSTVTPRVRKVLSQEERE